MVRDLSCGDLRIYLELEVRRVDCGRCGTVKRERLPWLADNPFYTKRFAFFVGRRCRGSTIKDVAQELHLHWGSVKELEKQYMREQLRRVGKPGPRVIGIDEISIRKGHTYRIVVSDLLRRRPIWFGGTDRSEASLTLFFNLKNARNRSHFTEFRRNSRCCGPTYLQNRIFCRLRVVIRYRWRHEKARISCQNR